MSDRELLELAAKAAGISLVEYHGKPASLVNTSLGEARVFWSPLTDDGDALRLAVKLQIVAGRYDNYVIAGVIGNDMDDVIVWLDKHQDPYEATRLAIVRAAALVGRLEP